MTLKEYIKQDLAARILSGDEPPSSLTLDRLSARYNVSITPVREAVSELLAEGVLQRDGGRRLTAGQRLLPDYAQSESSRPTTPEERFEMVSQSLVRLSIKGEPVLLREQSTAEEYDLSRTAIRQIFHRLASDGLLEHLPRRGWRLRPFLQSDLDSYIEIRVALERKALGLAKHRLLEEDLMELLERNRLPKNEQEAPKIEDGLHAYLIAKAENSYIANFFARQGRYYEMLFSWEALDRKAALQAVEQHREILESLIARDWEVAADRLENHIRHNHPVLRHLLKERASSESQQKE